MQTKDGYTVPAPLYQKLKENQYASSVFARMRPSCQKKYARLAGKAKNTEEKTDALIREITTYGQRHNWSGA